VDPDDGYAYTYEELVAFYAGRFNKKAIDAYWANECAPLTSKKKKPPSLKARTLESKSAGPKERARGINRQRSITFKHVFTKQDTGSLEDYEVDDTTIGKGAFGQVSKGVHKRSGQSRAIKAIEMVNIRDKTCFEAEIAIQQELNHPNIVRLFEVFKDPNHIYLVMELCTGGELFDLIQTYEWFAEKDAATYMQQILGAVNYLHSASIVHRDIKPENFLMQSIDEDAPIKVIDFGMSKKFTLGSGSMMRTKVGTIYYLAPQVLEQAYDEKCDIWSCGCMAYLMLCGFPPFLGSDGEVMRKVRAGSYEFGLEFDDISEAGKEFIAQMLTVDPASRPGAAALLGHQWLVDHAPKLAKAISADLGKRLRSFRNSSKLKKVALTIIAQQLDDSKVDDLKEYFEALDTDRRGFLSPSKIREGMIRNNIPIPPDFDDLMRSCDTDDSGAMDWTEFVASTLPREKYRSSVVLENAFRAFDLNDDKRITKAELGKLLGRDAESPTVVSVFDEADLDGDGEISLAEFKDMMRNRGDSITSSEGIGTLPLDGTSPSVGERADTLPD